jgi:hypothetical protein
MRKSYVIAATCFAAVFVYMLVGVTVQAFIHEAKWSDASSVLGTAAGIAAFVATVVYLIASSAFKKPGPPPAEPAYSPGRVAIGAAAVVVVGAAVGGGWMAYSQVAEQRASATAAKAAAAARRAQIDAMTPEQRVAMAAQREAQVQAAARAASASQAAAAAKKTADEAESARMARAGAGASLLKHAMKDPEAFTLTRLVVHPSGTACYEYRAKNGFGAIFPGSAVLTSKGKMLTQEVNGNAFVNAWNKECTPADGQEISDLIKRLGIV